MKPIKLEISGLQSFIEKQTIDFSAVESGIFGIFGKTGSGKSTILDGITLALYGYVNRISKNAEFINAKCNRAEVCLEFECDDRFYEVVREFKLKKNNNGVDSSAELRIKDGEEWKVIAEGPFQVDKKVEEIVGLSPTEFCQVIALPQGKFAEFLQAKPAERTSLISNIFGITEYAEKLYNNAKDNLNKSEKELSILEAEKDGVGNVSIVDIDEKQSLFEAQENELKELNFKVENLSAEYLNLVENSSLKKDQLRLKSELEELYKKSGDIKQDKNRLAQYENAKKLEIYVLNKERLENQLNELNDEVTALREQKQEQEMFFRDYEEQYKKFEAIQKSALIELDAKKVKILELEEDRVLTQKLNQEKERLLGELENKNNQYEDIILQIQTIDKSLDNIEKNILQLRQEKNEYEISKNKLGIVAENKSIESEIMLIEDFEKQIERVIENYKQELEDYKKDYTAIYKAERDNAQKINEISVSLDKVLGKSGKPIVERYKDVLGKLSNMDNVQDKYDFLALTNEKTKSETINFIEKVKELESQSEKIKSSLQEKIQFTNKLESELKNAQIKREEFLGENLLSLLVQNVDIGDSCPVCKGKVATKNTIPSSDISGLDREIANTRSTLSLARKDKEKTECSLATVNAQIQFLKSQIEINKAKYENVKSAQEKLYMCFVDKNDKQADNFKSMHEATFAASIALEKLLIEKDKMVNSSLSIIEERVECGAKIQSINEYIEKLTDVLYYLEKLRAEREFSIYNVQNESGLDYKKASKKLNEICDKIEDLSESLVNAEKEKEKQANSKLELTKAMGLNLAEKGAIEIKIENISESINSKDEKFAKLGIEIENDENPLDQINKKQIELQNKAEEFQSTYNAKIEQKQKSEKDYNLKMAILHDKNEELREVEAKLSNLSRTLGFENVEEVKRNIVDDSMMNELKNYIEEFEKRVSIVNVQLANIKEKVGTAEIDVDKVDKIKVELDQLKIKLSEKQVYFGVLQAQLSEMKSKKSKIDKIDEKLPLLRKKYDLAKELFALLRGKTLAEFMANEYVDMIIGFANEKLRILDGGRYKLFYENKEFYVEDNLNDGAKRIVSTLSGGETFLVSLALALSISDVISLQSDKKIDFFFLDEGFGTLDGELCQTVIEALYKLKSANLNIGLISHVKELQNALQFKFMVTKANENSGSKVRLEVGL